MYLNMLTTEDVTTVAKSIGESLTQDEINEIIENYPEAEENDPSATWNLIVEQQIHEIVNNR